ncbi:hypothetical protein [Rhizobium rhizophilum]|uniref:hypothetical protein n=1 Tax=Rhizobium rhizophilum TaxID=1850373 RepID=UPI00197CB712|nr:hypothetical protein [Rhizobium rhizophilum]
MRLSLAGAQLQWQVCSKARRAGPAGEYLCWIYGPGRTEFYLVGETKVVLDLPGTSVNFHGDQFPFVIERRHTSVEKWERVAGSVNIVVANRAFDAFVEQPGAGMLYRVRHGGRIIHETGPIDKAEASG